MGIVTIETVKDALMAIGVREGDGIIAHSSFKSFGEIENDGLSVVRIDDCHYHFHSVVPPV